MKYWSLALRRASHSESKRYLRVPCDTGGKITGSARLDSSIRSTFPFEGTSGFSLWNASIGSVEAVLALQGRLHDIRPTLGLELEGGIISKIGFQSGAQQVGQYFGIHCDLICSAEEFGFKYAEHLVVRPRPVSVQASTSIGTVIIGARAMAGQLTKRYSRLPTAPLLRRSRFRQRLSFPFRRTERYVTLVCKDAILMV